MKNDHKPWGFEIRFVTPLDERFGNSVNGGTL